MAITIAFLPEGDEIPAPESIPELDNLSDVPGATTTTVEGDGSTTTTEPGASTTSTSTGDSTTSTTAATTTATTGSAAALASPATDDR